MTRLKLFRLFTAVTCLCSTCGILLAEEAAGPDPSIPHRQSSQTGEQIISGVLKHSEKQDYQLQDYSVTRRYTLRNRHLDGESSLTVQLTYEAGKGKQFRVVHSEGEGVALHALMGLVKDEEKSSAGKASDNAFSPLNYHFTLEDKEAHDGRLCYHFRISPVREDKMLIDGELWVDAQDLAVVEIKGHPVRSLGFWIGKPLIDQRFASVDGFWMPSGNQTTAQVRIAGDTELSIQYSNYKFNLPKLSLRTQ